MGCLGIITWGRFCKCHLVGTVTWVSHQAAVSAVAEGSGKTQMRQCVEACILPNAFV